MQQSTIRKISKHLNDEQLKAYIDYTDAFYVYRKDRTEANLKKWNEADAKFLQTTNGKKPCEMIPLSVW